MGSVNTAFTVLKKIVRPSVVKFGITLSYTCNQRCKTCDTWKINRETPSLRDKEITLQEIQKFSESNDKVGPVWLALSGGEIFLRKDIRDILEALSTMPTVRLISIPTNGSLSGKIAEDLGYVLGRNRNPLVTLSIQVSLEGPQAVQQDITGVESSFSRARTTLGLLKSLSKDYPALRVQIFYTMSKYNQGYLRPTLEGLGYACPSYDKVNVGVAYNTGYFRLSDGSSTAPDSRSAREEIDWLRHNLPMKSWLDPLSLVSTRIFLKKVSSDLASGKPITYCTAGRLSSSMDPYWIVHPCCSLWTSNMGDLRDYGYNIMALVDDTEEFWKAQVADCLKSGGCRNPCENYTTTLLRPWRLL